MQNENGYNKNKVVYWEAMVKICKAELVNSWFDCCKKELLIVRGREIEKWGDRAEEILLGKGKSKYDT